MQNAMKRNSRNFCSVQNSYWGKYGRFTTVAKTVNFVEHSTWDRLQVHIIFANNNTCNFKFTDWKRKLIMMHRCTILPILNINFFQREVLWRQIVDFEVENVWFYRVLVLLGFEGINIGWGNLFLWFSFVIQDSIIANDILYFVSAWFS